MEGAHSLRNAHDITALKFAVFGYYDTTLLPDARRDGYLFLVWTF